MKRKNLLAGALIASILFFAACSGGGTSAKAPTLKNEEDSLNYVLGLLNGYGLKDTHFRTDSTDKNVAKFMSVIDEEFKSKSTDGVYNYGKNMGSMLKQQKKDGLEFDANLKFDSKLVMQGVINGMKGFDKGMSPEEAMEFFLEAKQKHTNDTQFELKNFEEGEE